MIYLLEGTIEPYAWGGYRYIADLLADSSLRRQASPIAELWFGDHPKAPAIITDRGRTQPLDQWLPEHPDTLTEEARKFFGKRLSFLLKILDVRLPLSIQVHPDKKQAEIGFTREERAGIARNAPERIYKDDNHKPEMMVALSEFWLLHGFAEKKEILRRLGYSSSLAEVAVLIETLPLNKAYEKIMRAQPETLARWLLPILESAPIDDMREPGYWIQYTTEAMNIAREALDPGLMCFFLFNIVCLHPGEGLVQIARLPHAYLRGQNIELMAASDNVLRAGLTPKHVALDELLAIVQTDPVKPDILSGQKQGDSIRYPTDIRDFAMELIGITAKRNWQKTFEQASIIFALEEAITMHSADIMLSIPQGHAAFASAGARVECRAAAQHGSRFVYATSGI